MSVSTNILRSYRAPRTVVRSLRSGHRREARILVYLMLACALFFVAQWPQLARQAQFDDTVPFEARMAGVLFGTVFLAPLMFYAIGGVLTLICRFFNAATDGFDVRLALFWALLVVSPLVLLQGLVSGIIGAGPQVALTGVIVFVVFAAVLGAGLRVALEAAREQA